MQEIDEGLKLASSHGSQPTNCAILLFKALSNGLSGTPYTQTGALEVLHTGSMGQPEDANLSPNLAHEWYKYKKDQHGSPSAASWLLDTAAWADNHYLFTLEEFLDGIIATASSVLLRFAVATFFLTIDI
ncbi:hypothetical protein McanMca71_001012 [Microsporum canis]|uniref:Uncharacterized protein n=1 Tax=Arthroderma otae (strain ATCC MYA-4605 / CBS 113480) TaxID=554155 RepID=C5FHU7_ARTOC|nr:uncharacterized protein MCYG_01746 [Microsporum canis CBS 113480]EEQ28927.1 predicted protein [Microsporum canis CBS 113480]